MIYLDSAATTLVKPPMVAQAAAYAIDHMASPGRGGHYPAMLAADTAFACREAIAELFHISDSSQVVFTLNATHALNIAIKSVVKPGDTVVISGYEHNAVTRPLAAIPDVTVDVARARLFSPEEMVTAFEGKLTEEVACVVCTHVSNVFGYVLPVEEIALLCRERGIPFVLDASQSAGVLDVDLAKLGAAFVAMPGHKGLYGPQGTGILLCGEGGEPLLYGGTGSLSALQEMPDFLPDRLEAGTHNITGIAGLLEGIRFVQRRGLEEICTHELALTRQTYEGLKTLPHVTPYGDPTWASQLGVLSFVVEGRDCEEVGQWLGEAEVAVRAGLHCAPTAHQTAGTMMTGTVRASFSAFNTSQEVETFLNLMSKL